MQEADPTGGTMPSYFFHIHDAGEIIRDEEGSVLPDVQSARTEAIQSARDILAEHVRAGDVVDGRRFEVADETGKVLFVVPFADLVRLHEGDPPDDRSH